MSIAILLQQILIIFLEIGTGAAVTKLGIMDDRNSKFLSNLVMSVTLPCTLLASASIDGGREAVAGMRSTSPSAASAASSPGSTKPSALKEPAPGTPVAPSSETGWRIWS